MNDDGWRASSDVHPVHESGGLLCHLFQLTVVVGMAGSLLRADSDGIGSAMVLVGLSGLVFELWSRTPPLRMALFLPLVTCAVVAGLLFFLGGIGSGRLLMVFVLPLVGIALVVGPYVWIGRLLRVSMRRRLGHVVALLVVITWFWGMRPMPMPPHSTFRPFSWKAAPVDRRYGMAEDFLSRPDIPGMPADRLVELLGKPVMRTGETEGRFTYDLGTWILGSAWLEFEVENGVVVEGHIELPDID